ncbi:MAG: RDD family protein [Anaerobacillus sp.]
MKVKHDNSSHISNPAGMLPRFFGNLLDGLLLLGIALIFSLNFNQSKPSIMDAVNLLYYILLPLLWVGFTVGKRIVGVQIQRVNGDRISLWTMVKRYLIPLFIYLSPMIIAVLCLMLFIDAPWGTILSEKLYTLNQVTELEGRSEWVSTVITLAVVSSLLIQVCNFFMVLARKDHRGIHDFIAGTYVRYIK